jgi:surface antigen
MKHIAGVVVAATITSVAAASGAGHHHDEHAIPCRDEAYMGIALTRDINCRDQSDAAGAYRASLNGDIDRFYPWYHDGHYGSFQVRREYRDGPHVCRDFHGVSYRDGYRFEDNGTACKLDDGTWQTR